METEYAMKAHEEMSALINYFLWLLKMSEKLPNHPNFYVFVFQDGNAIRSAGSLFLHLPN